MTRRLTLVAAWLVGGCALTGVVGCNGSGGPIPFNQFEPTALAAACRFDVLCGGYPDQATCMTSEQTQPHLYDTLGQDIASGKVAYDGAAARTCIDAINGLASCNRSTLNTISLIPACNAIFAGSIAVGGACFFSEECVGGGTCLAPGNCTSGQCCAGTCQTPTVTVQLGGDCSSSGEFCVAGTACLSNAASGGQTCQKAVAAGGACAGSTACAAGLYCDSTSATCKPLVASGGACNPALGSQDCDGLQDFCDQTTSLCTPPVSVGSPCGNVTSNVCVSYASCDATSGTCVARPVVGAACDATGGPSCLSGSCDATSGTCMLMPTAGACS